MGVTGGNAGGSDYIAHIAFLTIKKQPKDHHSQTYSILPLEACEL